MELFREGERLLFPLPEFLFLVRGKGRVIFLLWAKQAAPLPSQGIALSFQKKDGLSLVVEKV